MAQPLQTRWKEDSLDSTIIYLGAAPLGALDTDAEWRISKIDTTNGLIQYSGDGGFNSRWVDRETVEYT